MTREVTDALGTPMQIPVVPQRVVSLCPSQTETLVALGLGHRLVGRTKFCIHPKPDIEAVTVVGGTKQVRMDALLALQPDLVIAEKEEQTPEMVAEIRQHVPVYVTDVRCVPSALQMIQTLGNITDTEPAAIKMINRIQAEWASLSPLSSPRRVAYFIWRGPWMLAGHNTFINSVLSYIGLQNVLPPEMGRYPSVELEDLSGMSPEWLLLSSEPYPFDARHVAELSARFPNAQVRLVDGEMFSWYGVRMAQMPNYLRNMMSGN